MCVNIGLFTCRGGIHVFIVELGNLCVHVHVLPTPQCVGVLLVQVVYEYWYFVYRWLRYLIMN